MDSKRSGLTLIELLVAMMILLVGIYSVARGFPRLFGLLESERVRTEMARSAEQELERLKLAPHQIPAAITGYCPVAIQDEQLVAFAPDIYPEATPDDPDVMMANPRDDLIEVSGELFEAPGVRPGSQVSIYPLRMGPAGIADPANPGEYLEVYHLTRLERLEEPPRGNSVPDGYFYLGSDGQLFAPVEYEHIHIDYAWADEDGVLHWVENEAVPNPGYVRAADVDTPMFSNVVPDMSRGKGRHTYEVAAIDPEEPYPPAWLPERTVAIDPVYGTTIALPAADAHRVMHVSYQVKMEPDFGGYLRRVQLMREDFEAPADTPYEHDLKLGLLEDEWPLFDEALDGTPLDLPVNCLIVDLATGETWTDADEWITLDESSGKLTFAWQPDGPAPLTAQEARGRSLRAYYRTIYDHTIMVQKAPSYFIEDAIAATYADERHEVLFRTYSVRRSAEDGDYAELLFPKSAIGQTVVVDYVVGEIVNGSFIIDRRVNNEMHVIRPLSDTDPAYVEPEDAPDAIIRPRGVIALNHPVADETTGAIGVMGVRGASLTVRAWWNTPQGRVQRISLDTLLMPRPLL